MINIDNLQISEDASEININITTDLGNVFTSVKLWTVDTYKTISNAIDLSSLISGVSNIESITILPENIDSALPYFKSAYYIEFTSNSVEDNIITGVTANFTDFFECLLNKSLQIEVEDCNHINYGDCPDCAGDIFYTSSLMHGLEVALKMKHFTESIPIIKNLNNLCDTCQECGDEIAPVKTIGASFKTVNNTVIIG